MRKNVSLLMVVVLTLIMLFTACQGKTNSNSNSQGDTAKEQGLKPGERVKLSLMFDPSAFVVPPDVDPQNNKWADIYKKAFPEVDFNFIPMPSSGAAEKKNLMIASGEVPDMMPASQMEIINWSSQGAITPMDDIVKKYYPNIQNFITPDDIKIATYNGKMWGLPTPNSSLQNPQIMYIRKDWLDNLNLSMPTTIDELYKVLDAFTNKDPDKNGKKDTFGLGVTKGFGNSNALFNPFDVQIGFWSRVNGKVVADNIRPEMKDALIYMNRLFADGLIDKDSMNQNATQAEEKIVQGRYGVAALASYGMNGRVNFNLVKQTPGAEMVPLPPLKGPKGSQWLVRGRNTGTTYAVSSTMKYPEYPAKILNWLLEQDKSKSYYALNADLINCGEVGVHAALAGKFITNLADGALSEDAKKDNYRYSYRLMFGSMNMVKDQDQILLAQEMVKAGQMTKGFATDKETIMKYGHYDDKIVSGPVYAELIGQLNTYFDEVKLKIITGAEPSDSFDKWVEYFNKGDGTKVTDEVNKMNPAK